MSRFYRTFSIILSSLSATVAFAQSPSPTPNLTSLFPGYAPTVLTSETDMNQYFDDMPGEGFTEDRSILGIIKTEEVSQCYRRAHLWAYHFSKNLHIDTQKVFVFYTHQFKEDNHRYTHRNFNWWFHVAPYVLFKNPKTGIVEERVMDAEFASTPLTMRAWTDIFIKTKRACKEWVPYEKFKNEVEAGDDAVWGTEHCYLVRAPMTDLEPEDIAARQLGKKTGYEFSQMDLADALMAPTKSSLGDFQELLGLKNLKPMDRDEALKPKPAPAPTARGHGHRR